MPEPEEGREWLAPLATAIRCIILFIAVLPVLLTAADTLDLSTGETTSWILAAYGLAGLVGLGLAARYRQPLLTTGNLFALIFVASLAQTFTYPELIGAFLVAGAGVLLVSALGLTGRLSSWLPAPIVFGLLAGAVVSFVAQIFTALIEAPIVVGSTFLAYLLGRRFLDRQLPAILPALVVGLALAALLGHFGQMPDRQLLPVPELTMPVFSLQAIATVSPVLIVLIILQSNLPSVVFLREQGYQPPERVVDTASGLGTILGSFVGPIGLSLSLPVTSLVATPAAGKRESRHRAVYLAAGGLVLIALLAGFAAELPQIIPAPLLQALAGLALFNVLLNALQEATQGPLLLGPVIAFAIVLSDVSFLGFGDFFWALVLGTAVSLLLEREEMETLREEAAENEHNEL